MNYIGSKYTLLPFITQTIDQLTGGVKVEYFADLFAGTGCVGSLYRRRGAIVISNDIQYYSYVLNKHLIEGGYNDFRNINLDDNFRDSLFPDKISTIREHLRAIPGEKGFVYNNYCIEGTSNKPISRSYFSNDNAKKCDAIRQQIEQWHNAKQINQDEYFQLLTGLLESADKVANTASVYAAFLKQLKYSALKPLLFDFTTTLGQDPKGVVYNEDANTLIQKIEGQVLYLDPPYNHRQYAPNYHILETIARYDNPSIRGVSGLRDYSNQRSTYCTKTDAEESLNELIVNSHFNYIFLSYNNEGIISPQCIEKIMKGKGKYTRVEKQYQRFKADNNRQYKSNTTTEYIHCLKCDK